METLSESETKNLTAKAAGHVSDILSIAIEYRESEKALVIYDTETGLSQILLSAYKNALPNATFIDFNSLPSEEIVAAFDTLSPKDLVVLIQSSNFRLSQFRIRLRLFQKQLKVIDHMHLHRNTPESWNTYIEALEYDPNWYRVMGPKLKAILEETTTLTIHSPECTLTISEGLEIPKLNIGDYSEMTNVGGTFPIGEVFTEAKDLTKMNGSVMIYAFADKDFCTTMYDPFEIKIENGIIVGWSSDTPRAFIEIVEEVRKNERAVIREIGFGLNRAITRKHYLKDITAFERIHGLHFSLGEKHTVYKKEGIKADKTRYHVDIFPVIDTVFADDTQVFRDGEYVI